MHVLAYPYATFTLINAYHKINYLFELTLEKKVKKPFYLKVRSNDKVKI